MKLRSRVKFFPRLLTQIFCNPFDRPLDANGKYYIKRINFVSYETINFTI